jgi:hypothetical protein
VARLLTTPTTTTERTNPVTELVASPFAEQRRQDVGDTAGSRALQQRENTQILAMATMAKRFPRDVIAATDKILNAFTRPTLAERASYQYSKGGTDVNGPSIRAAEAMAQMWGNLSFGFREVSRGIGHDGVPYSEVEAFCWDMETTTYQPLQFFVRHWRDTKSGGYKIKDERDIYELCANQAQRRKRACILAVIPGDVIEAAMKQADVTLRTKADTSPEAMAKMVEAFEPFGVTKEQIEKRIQRRLDSITPAQVVTLKRIYASLRDEMSTAADWFEFDESTTAKTPAPPPPPALPTLADDAFAKKLATWRKPVDAGTQTPADVMAFATSKFTLSDEQRAEIEKLREPAGDASAESQKGGAA